jgi:hypothetical protein
VENGAARGSKSSGGPAEAAGLSAAGAGRCGGRRGKRARRRAVGRGGRHAVRPHPCPPWPLSGSSLGLFNFAAPRVTAAAGRRAGQPRVNDRLDAAFPVLWVVGSGPLAPLPPARAARPCMAVAADRGERSRGRPGMAGGGRSVGRRGAAAHVPPLSSPSPHPLQAPRQYPKPRPPPPALPHIPPPPLHTAQRSGTPARRPPAASTALRTSLKPLSARCAGRNPRA